MIADDERVSFWGVCVLERSVVVGDCRDRAEVSNTSNACERQLKHEGKDRMVECCRDGQVRWKCVVWIVWWERVTVDFSLR